MLALKVPKRADPVQKHDPLKHKTGVHSVTDLTCRMNEEKDLLVS